MLNNEEQITMDEKPQIGLQTEGTIRKPVLGRRTTKALMSINYEFVDFSNFVALGILNKVPSK